MPVPDKPKLNEYRCALSDCRKLLFKGSFTGTIERLCMCGNLNTFTVQAEQKPESQQKTDKKKKK